MNKMFDAISALDAVGDGVICANDALIVNFINKKACTILEKRPENVLGSSIEQMMAVQTDDGMFISEIANQVLENGISQGLRANSYMFTDTKQIYLSASFSRMELDNGYGLVINFRDITRLKQFEFDYLKEKDKFESLFETMPMGVIVINSDGNVLYYNPFVEKQFGINDLDEKLICNLVLCQNILVDQSWDNEACHQCSLRLNIEKIKNNQPYERSVKLQIPQIINEEKIIRDYQVEFGAIHEADNSDIMLIIQDITKQREYEDQLKAARKEAQDASKLKGQFLANMSHEIRTPLNGIIGMIDLTRHMVEDEELIDNLKTAKTSSEGLLRIINDVLDYSKLEAEKMKFREKAFSVKEFADEIARENGFEAKLKGLSMNLVIDSSVKGSIISDKLRLKQVFNNLIGNSIKFTESGGITLKITAHLHKEDSIELTVVVADTGIGIDEDQKDMLFESFTQVDGSYTRKIGGTGLGLAISKEIVEKLGGTITFNSVLGKGTEFIVVIPFRLGADWSSEEVRQAQAAKALSSGHVLLVEDDMINQMVIRKKLEMNSYQVDVAENGKVGLEMFEGGQYDLVIMDIQMPVMSGTEAIDLLRETEKGKRTPVIALTALALHQDRRTIMNHGFDIYITKPVELDEMATIVGRMIRAKSTYEYVDIALEEKIEMPVAKNQRDMSEVNHYLRRIKSSLNEENLIALEKDCSALKEYFETQHMSEYRMLAFKMAMEARKEKMVQVEHYFNNIVAKLETVI